MSKRILITGRITKRNGRVVESTVLSDNYTGISWGKGNRNV